MNTERDDRLVWIDVETTGLNPESDLLLEIACIVTDNTLEEIDGSHWVLHHPKTRVDLWRRHAPDVVDTMHEASGLWAELPAGHDLDYVESALTTLLDDTLADGARLAGSSVHFDRAWLKEYLPSIESRLHYRNLDVSSVAHAVNQWTGCGTYPKAKAHRAWDDIQESINEYRWLREQVEHLGDRITR